MNYRSTSADPWTSQRNGGYTSLYSTLNDNSGNSKSYDDYNNNKDIDERIQDLRKSIREQTILLSVLDDGNDNQGNIDELQNKIRNVSQELKKTLDGNQQQTQVRYEQNMRRLQDLTDEGRTLKKEIDYLIDTGIKNVQSELMNETNRLKELELELARIKHHADNDPIRAKAHAMIASRLNSPLNDAYTTQLETNAQERKKNMDHITHDIEGLQQNARQIIQIDLPVMDTYIDINRKQNRDRQMFEKGLFVAEPLARFIDSIESSNTTELLGTTSTTFASSPLSYDNPKPKSAPMFAAMDQEDYLSYTPTPPPIPTTQRPGSPRSAADIKAEAQRRIEQRRLLFVNKYNQQRSTENLKRNSTKSDDASSVSTISAEEKAAQERLRQAEQDARERLQIAREQRAKVRQEAEEKRKQALAAREVKLLEQEKQRQLQEEKEQKEREVLAEKRRKEEAEILERRRKEIEEHERRERELQLKREEEEKAAEEVRLRRIREAAERAAREKRRRQEEIEKKEREREAARAEAEKRRREWLETQENSRREKEAAAKREQEEKERKEREEEERQRQEELEEQRRKQAEEEAAAAAAAVAAKEAEEAALAQKEVEVQIDSQQNTTAGTSGYGVDIEDEVDFTTIYRVKSLYEYHGARNDDLSFGEDEIIKAHPHKESTSDWWYGSSLTTKQVGFFPKAYVEIIEKAFRVRAIYEFSKTRQDDLAFVENEIIIVQPFQDDDSDWWYGTSEDSHNSGYFPKTYVEVINPGVPSIQLSEPTTLTSPMTTQQQQQQQETTKTDEPQRGMSAPNTPVLKKQNLTVSRTDTARRRRATSNAGIPGSNEVPIGRARAMSVPIQRPGSPGILTWASTMDEKELEAIPADERKRQETIFELISTEKTYLRDLQLVINVFYADSAKYLSRDEQDVVFSNIDELLLCNTALLSDLESRQQESGGVISNIGDVFLKHVDNLNSYSTYCRNQSFASRFLQDKRQQDQWFNVFLKTAQSRPECRALDLSHFLLEPMQRITRYPLLLQNILNATPKKHPDYGVLRSALAKAENILQRVNEETRRYENSQKMRELSRLLDMENYGRLDVPTREFVMEGVLYKSKSGRKLHGYLFNDVFILTEPLKGLSPEGYLYRLYKEPMDIDMVTIRQQHQNLSLKASFTSNTSGNSSDDNAFQIVYGSNVIGVKASSASQKRQWISQIQHYSALQLTLQRQISAF